MPMHRICYTKKVGGTGSELDIERIILDGTASNCDIEVDGNNQETVTPRMVRGAGLQLGIKGEILDRIKSDQR